MKKLYIIAGPNGAGKTTASYRVLPEIFDCLEFVNADEIARGISPLNPDAVAIQSGRIMLKRIHELLDDGKTFAVETTLSSNTYVSFIKKAKNKEYDVILLFLKLNSEELAIERVKTRVLEGGHNIPINVIRRRYHNGLKNLFNKYRYIVDKWILVDNSEEDFQTIANGSKNKLFIKDDIIWNELIKQYDGS